MNEERKGDHIDICIKENVSASHNFWDDIKLVHQALPELDMDSVDTGVRLFRKKLEAPLVIAAITGGHPKAKEINKNLAEAAARKGVGMGVGSQRAALEDKKLADTYSVVKDYDVPLMIGNVGAPQLISQKGKAPLDMEAVGEAMEMVGADVVAVHLNYLQEVVQPEGDTNAVGCLRAIKALAMHAPLIVKETGAGISKEMASALRHTGVLGVDVGGAGGTSWSAVEVYRARAKGDKVKESIGQTFWDWGVPTPISVMNLDIHLPIIATGGIRTGLDAARAIAVGADSAGVAREVLEAATVSADAVEKKLETIIRGLKAAMFLTGSGSVKDLKTIDYIITGETRDWVDNYFSHSRW